MKLPFLRVAGAILICSTLPLYAVDLVNPKPETFCNPINVDYMIQKDHEKGWYREAADPVALYFKGNYYLFASKSGGYWVSVTGGSSRRRIFRWTDGHPQSSSTKRLFTS